MLNAERMIAEAERATGLADWGGSAFREPFGVLIEALNTEAQLHADGERIAHRHLHDVLCGRLRMAADRQRLPGIAAEKIAAPVFVIGLPRSGTTFCLAVSMKNEISATAPTSMLATELVIDMSKCTGPTLNCGPSQILWIRNWCIGSIFGAAAI